MHLSRRTLALLAAPVLLAGPARQAPNAEWRTIRTAHYRIHYPPMLADWAQDVASRIEGIHGAVTKLVGYECPMPIQIVLQDPMEEANGMTIPLLPQPVMIYWRTHPESDELHAGTMASWTEDLATHETAHIQHLMRPQNKPNIVDHLFALPVGPVLWKSPRWVIEGYATLVEGKLTGSGRPHSATRAALLRQWALQGKLPDYGALNGSAAFLGGNMAYMVGSAYLEWLERQRPEQPDILPKLWKQIASRRHRKFEESFQATFGFTARDGYDRFRAELDHDALEWEARVKAEGLREGELWTRSAGLVADLSVSPDGSKLLARVAENQGAGLRVWDLNAAPKADPKEEKRKAEEAKDPNEVADVQPEVPAREPIHRLPAIDFRVPNRAQWVDDGTVLFQLKHADNEGVLTRHPALWSFKDGLDLNPSRVPAPRGSVLKPVHRDGRWILEYKGRVVPLPGQAVGQATVDEAKGVLYAACELDGTWNLVRVPVTAEGFGEAQRLTRTASAVWNPAPSPDGKTLFFTKVDARGLEIRKLDLTQPALETKAGPEARILAPAAVLPPAMEPDPLPPPAPVPPSTPYKATENLWNHLQASYTNCPAGESMQIGMAGSDVLGRFSWQALAGFGQLGGPGGATAGLSYGGWAWKPSLNLFLDREKPSEQRYLPLPGLDRERRGAELAFTYDDRGDSPFWASPVLAWERVESLDGRSAGDTANRSLAGLRAGAETRWARGQWGLGLKSEGQWYEGRTKDWGPSHDWNLGRGSLALHGFMPHLPLTFKAEAGRTSGYAGEAFHLGGLTTSLVPVSLDASRVEQPALPAFEASGGRFRRWRAEAGVVLRAYVEGTALWNAEQPRGPYQRVAGLELSLDELLQGGSELGLHKVGFTLGAHHILDGPLKKHDVVTFSIVVRP